MNNEELFKSYINMANLYRREYNYSKAELFYNKALEIYKILAEEESSKFQIRALNIYEHLSVIYNSENRFQKTKDTYMESLTIYKRIISNDSDRYK
ncbi:MAG TPA: tetratricopeptide repeat protein, partial [Sulfurovum sp.]|nr:tetratricopeptide repeat protein [Sulfurovum sp.]